MPVLEGGKRVTNWRVHSGGIWVADAANITDCRQFWVAGNRRERASSSQLYTVQLWDDPATSIQTDGVVAPAGAFGNYTNLGDVELQFNHYWHNSHIAVTETIDNGNGYSIRIPIDLPAHDYGPIDNTTRYRVVNAFEQDDLFASPNADPPVGLEAPCVGNIIRANYIHQIGVEYKSSVGIAAYYPQQTDISYNEINAIPYTGISLGWGWDYIAQVVVNKNNRIHHNRVGDYMNVLNDGGAIYTNG